MNKFLIFILYLVVIGNASMLFCYNLDKNIFLRDLNIYPLKIGLSLNDFPFSPPWVLN